MTDVYASPFFKARPGSTHGYDVTDPAMLNPELGGRAGFDALSEELRRRDMGLVLDVVPNHMAMSSENPWWMDVLEHGPSSRYSSFFDIDWQAPALDGRILVPILGRPYGEALESGELTLGLEDGAMFVRSFEHRLPVDPRAYGRVDPNGEYERALDRFVRSVLASSNRGSAGTSWSSRASWRGTAP